MSAAAREGQTSGGRRTAVAIWSAALLVAGTWAASRAPVEWAPQVELPEVRVSASWPGASPRQVERYVAAPIERALQAVPGTAGVESLSEEGRAFVTASVAESAELGPYVAQVGEAVGRLRGTLPDRVAPRLTKRVPEALREEQGFMTLQLVGPATPDALRTLAEETVAPRLRSVPGVADVLVEGGTERELLVALDAGRLAAYGLTATDVRQPLAEVLRGDVYGALRARGERLLLVSPAEDEVEALRDLVVNAPSFAEGAAAVRLGDVADVRLGPAPLRSITRIDGQAVVSLTVERARGTSMIAASRAVQGRLGALEETLPEGDAAPRRPRQDRGRPGTAPRPRLARRPWPSSSS